MPVDVGALWNFSDPAQSESRFRDLLDKAGLDDQLILRTQIARSLGMRKDFVPARGVLEEVEPHLAGAGPEPNVRYWLELGRTYCSATHPSESQTDEAREMAREAFTRATELAKEAQLDGLAVDALHMMAMVDTDPEDQIQWNLKAIAYMEASEQPEAKKWEGSLRNNLGYALATASRYDEALQHLRLARLAREKAGNEIGERIARWMVAWTLRLMGRIDEAIKMQLVLEMEWDSLGEPDPYVFEELEHLFRAQGDEAKAVRYGELRQSLTS